MTDFLEFDLERTVFKCFAFSHISVKVGKTEMCCRCSSILWSITTFVSSCALDSILNKLHIIDSSFFFRWEQDPEVQIWTCTSNKIGQIISCLIILQRENYDNYNERFMIQRIAVPRNVFCSFQHVPSDHVWFVYILQFCLVPAERDCTVHYIIDLLTHSNIYRLLYYLWWYKRYIKG